MADEVGALRAVLALESAAFDRGVASARRQLQVLEGGLGKTAGQVSKFGTQLDRGAARGFQQLERSSGAARAQLQTVGYQVQDLAVQIAGGTSATRALSQQLPQLLSGFGLFGVLAGTAAAVMIPFASYLIGAGEEAVSLEDRLKGLQAAMTSLDSATKAAQQPISELLATYGQYADQAQEVAQVNRQLAYLDAASALSATATTMTELFGVLQFGAEYSADMAAELDRLYESVNGINPEAVEDIVDRLGIGADQAQLLAEQLVKLGEARGPDEQVAALQDVIEQLELATGGAFKMDEATRTFYKSLLDALSAAQQLAAIDMASGVSVAADEAARLAKNLFAARQQELAASGKVYSGRGGDPRTSNDQGRGFKYDGPALDLNNNVVGKKGGGGGKSAAEKERTEMEREAAKVFGETRTAAEKYAIELERLNQLQAGGYITADTYGRALKDLEAKHGGLAESLKGIKSAAGEAFTSLITGAKSAGEALGDLLESLANTLANSAFNSIAGALFPSLTANANGNAFSNGRVQAFASGGIVTRPTLFPMATGAGLMGEAGPEAIMPLTRIGGKLGVRSQGGGGTVISIDARGAVEGTDARIAKALQAAYPGLMRDSVAANRMASGRGY